MRLYCRLIKKNRLSNLQFGVLPSAPFIRPGGSLAAKKSIKQTTVYYTTPDKFLTFQGEPNFAGYVTNH